VSNFWGPLQTPPSPVSNTNKKHGLLARVFRWMMIDAIKVARQAAAQTNILVTLRKIRNYEATYEATLSPLSFFSAS
jgi:hypothetical protein